MHRIIESCVKKFSAENDIEFEELSKKFEYFANYVITYEKFPNNFDFKELTSDEVDGGIDGIIFFIDDELASTLEEVKSIFSRPKKSISVNIIFTQAKTSEHYDMGEILKFSNGIEDFIAKESTLPQGEFLKEAKIIFNYIIDNVARVRNARPNCLLYYVCTSNNDIETEIEAIRLSTIKKVNDTGLFNSVDFEYVGLSRLMKLWGNTINSSIATLSVEKFVPYPTMGGITEAYIAIISIREFINQLLLTEDGKIKLYIFEENVRAFLGEENAVNKKIKETLTNTKQCDKFAIFNNGITIISPDVKVQSNKISLENYQIVNGCQTSNVLFECREQNIDSAYITVKIIEATDSDVISDIVSATNNQSKVDDNQFLAFNPFVRRLEKYFEGTQDIPNNEVKLYFERRLGQYKNTEIPKRKIFSIIEVGRALGALFLQKPDLASRYPNKFISEMAKILFYEKNKEEAFYLAALVDYKLKPFYQKNRILGEYAIYKWHILTIFGYLASKDSPPTLQNKRKIQQYSNILLPICCNDDKLLSIVEKIPYILNSIGLKNNRDEVRSATYAKQVLEYCNTNLKKEFDLRT